MRSISVLTSSGSPPFAAAPSSSPSCALLVAPMMVLATRGRPITNLQKHQSSQPCPMTEPTVALMLRMHRPCEVQLDGCSHKIFAHAATTHRRASSVGVSPELRASCTYARTAACVLALGP
jgi:hypothetical protein